MAQDTCPQCGGIGKVDVGRPVQWTYSYSCGYWFAEVEGSTLLAWHDPTHPDGPCWMWLVRSPDGETHGQVSERWRAKTGAEEQILNRKEFPDGESAGGS